MTSKHTFESIGTAVVLLLCASLLGVGAPAGAALAEHPSNAEATSAPGALGDGAAQAGDRKHLVVESTGDERANYTVSASGSIEFGEEANPVKAEYPDSIDGNTARGSVAGGSDDYYVTGEITGIDIDGPATVSVDGEPVNPADVGTTTTPTATRTQTTTETEMPTATDTETATRTATTARTETATETEIPTATATETATATGTTAAETGTATDTVGRVDGGVNDGQGGVVGLSSQERDLFVTIGGILLLGIVVIGGFALLARR